MLCTLLAAFSFCCNKLYLHKQFIFYLLIFTDFTKICPFPFVFPLFFSFIYYSIFQAIPSNLCSTHYFSLKYPVCGNNSKVNEGNQLKNKAKITGRTTSVRAQSSFMPKKRTGTITQPQSAAEANKTRKAPGKLLAPHPPSAPLPGNRSGKNAASPGYQPLPPSALQATATIRNDLNERHVVLADGVLNRNGTENSKSMTCRSDLATAISTPGCSTAKFKPWAKNTCSVNSIQTSACQKHPATCTERRPVNAENGLHLHHIPAAGKTSTSWQGAHTAPAPEDLATGKSHVAGFGVGGCSDESLFQLHHKSVFR